jgi:hypothetical protein
MPQIDEGHRTGTARKCPLPLSASTMRYRSMTGRLAMSGASISLTRPGSEAETPGDITKTMSRTRLRVLAVRKLSVSLAT